MKQLYIDAILYDSWLLTRSLLIFPKTDPLPSYYSPGSVAKRHDIFPFLLPA